MIKNVLNATEAPPETSQREQIFHSRCMIANKSFNLIMDRGSYTNATFTGMVSKLNLATIEHPKPYTL